MLSLLPLALAVVPLAAPQSEVAGVPRPRVVVLVLEGLGADGVEARIEAGGLPHLAALVEEGALHRVRSLPGVDAPAVQTALLTGTSPAANGVTGFVTRLLSPAGPQPFFGHVAPSEVDVAVADQGGRELPPVAAPCWRTTNVAPFVWEVAAAAGAPSIALRAPMAFDRPAVPGAQVLFGAGYPDARGQLGDWFVYTSEYDERTVAPDGRATITAGTVYSVPRYGGRLSSWIYGPRDFAREAELRREVAAVEEELSDPALTYQRSIELIDEQRRLEDEVEELRHGVAVPLVIAPDGDGARVRIGDEEQRVAVGAWSAPYRPTFPLARGLVVHALTRVKLVSLDPFVRLYVHRLDVDPAHAPRWQPASRPASFAAQLAAAHGPFETYGWTTATMAFKDGEVSAATVVESAGWTLERERALWRGALEREDWRLLVGTFAVGAQLRFALTHLAEPDHPLHDPAAAAGTARFLGDDVRVGDAIDAVHAALDALVGETRAALGDGDVLLVASANGVSSFRRQFHLNNWLAEEGFLAADLAGPTQALRSVDWGATRAYALGLGGIYLSLAGREASGTVAPEDVDETLDELERALLAARDPSTGARPVSAVFRPRELFHGAHADSLPDLVVGFAPPYRVSWATTLGGLAVERGGGGEPALAPIVVDNETRWTGAEPSVDPAAIEGVLVASVPLTAPGEGAVDLRVLAPTVLALLGVEVPAGMDVAPLAR